MLAKRGVGYRVNAKSHTNAARAEQPEEELQLSPSEAAAHNAAMRLSGAGRGEVAAKTQRALASITLGFEMIVVVLIGLAIFGLSLLENIGLGALDRDDDLHTPPPLHNSAILLSYTVLSNFATEKWCRISRRRLL